MNAGNNQKRIALGNALTHFCIYGMLISSGLKFVHPARVLAYMGSLGYRDGTFFFIAGLEFAIAILFWLPATRRSPGILLVSAYFGGAIAAHLAAHPYVSGGPFLVYMITHPYFGALEPGVFLAAAWIGTWLTEPRPDWKSIRHSKPAPYPGHRQATVGAE